MTSGKVARGAWRRGAWLVLAVGLGGCLGIPAGQIGTADQTPGPRGPIFGTVTDEQGRPAVNAKVLAFSPDSNPLAGSGLAGNAGSGLAGNAGSGLIGNTGSGLADSAGVRQVGDSSRRYAATGEVRTDANGHFVMDPGEAGTYNLEAILRDDLKAWQGAVKYGGSGQQVAVGSLRLAPTGQISGRVKAGAGVSDFSNTQVYIPGSSYVSIARPDGSYTISNVPAGSFGLQAFHVDLGDAALTASDGRGQPITVIADRTTAAPDLNLTLTPPVLERITRAGSDEMTDNAAPGTAIDLHGKQFGHRRGTRFAVHFTRAVPVSARRISDELLRVTVPEDAASGKVAVTVGSLVTDGLPIRALSRLEAPFPRLTLSPGATADLGASLVVYDSDGQVVRESRSGTASGQARPNVTWTSDSGILTVDDRGVVEALAAGQARLSVKAGRVPPQTIDVTVAPGVAVAVGTGKPGRPAPDDGADAAVHHDYVVTRNGVASTFVWIPIFTAVQIIRPNEAGVPGAPKGSWVKDRPAAGQEGVDWGVEVFGGFYAAKFEASRSDATPGTPGNPGTATAGSDYETLKSAQYCVPWTDITWDEAVTACAAYHPNAHLMRDDEWTALAVWATISGHRPSGNSAQIDQGATYSAPADVDDPGVTFLDDPTSNWSANGVDRSLTGSGRSEAWTGEVNLTTHTGTAAGVYDLAGNCWEWTLNIGAAVRTGNYLIDGADTGFTAGKGQGDAPISSLHSDSRLRRFGLPSGTGIAASAFGQDYLWKDVRFANRAFRGGAWLTGGKAGVWALFLSAVRSHSANNVGFRPALSY